jgi:O-antigen/teichoic acid export membrane protein
MTTTDAQTSASADPALHGASLLSDARLSTLGAIVSTGLAGVSSILIARGLGVTARGRWAVISSLSVLIATVGGAGLATAAAYAAARLRGSERERTVAAALTGAGVLGALAAVVFLVVAAVIRPPASTAPILLAAAIPAVTIVYGVTHQLTLTEGSMRWFASAQIVSASVVLAAVIALYVTGELTVLAVVILSSCGSAIGAAVCLTAIHRRHALGDQPRLPGPIAAWGLLRPYLAYALTTFAILSLTQIVQRVDILLVGGFRGPHAAGLYAVATQITELMLVVPAALGLVVFRRGARSVPRHYDDAVRVLMWSGAFGVAAALVAFVIAPWIIPLVYGSAYRGSVAPLRLMLPGTVAFSLQSVLSQYLAGRGRPRVVLIAWLAGAGAGLVADLVVIPASGITGAAIVSSLSYILVTGLHFRALRAVRPAAA